MATESSGLSATTAAERLKQDGFNELPSPDRRGRLRIVLEVVHQPMFALLIGSGIGALPATALFWLPAKWLLRFGQPNGNDLAISAAAGITGLFILEATKSLWFSAAGNKAGENTPV